jgi:hypothetical protein
LDVPHPADDALRHYANAPPPPLDAAAVDSFDLRILDELRANPPPVPLRRRARRSLKQALAAWNAIPAGFFAQLAGGGLIAAALTGVFLFTALHSGAGRPASHWRAAIVPAVSSEPPVPLETLLESPAPRAALLWTSPARTRVEFRASRASRAPNRDHRPTEDNRHGAILRRIAAG